MVGAMRKAPKYFQESGYRCPTDPRDGLMQYAFQTKLSTFDFFSSLPTVFRDFNTFMGNTMGARGYWVDWFPVEERLLNEDYDHNTALLVDVGAGRGHDLVAFHKKFPGLGRLVLQDLPNIIESMGQIDPAIELIKYDFFTEQPVIGIITSPLALAPAVTTCSPLTHTLCQAHERTSSITSCTTGLMIYA